jgi:hypothetical protein
MLRLCVLTLCALTLCVLSLSMLTRCVRGLCTALVGVLAAFVMRGGVLHRRRQEQRHRQQ